MISLEKLKEIQLDVYSLQFRDLLPLLKSFDTFDSKKANEWREKLLSWDGILLSDSQEATVFQLWDVELYTYYAEEVGRDHWGSPVLIRQTFVTNRTSETDKFAREAFERAAERFSVIPRWGEMHTVSIQSTLFGKTISRVTIDASPIGCLWRRELPFGGDGATVNVGPYNKNTFSLNF